MEIRLDGRKALITGGSKGLGLAMATTFAESGADVALRRNRAAALWRRDDARGCRGSPPWPFDWRAVCGAVAVQTPLILIS